MFINYIPYVNLIDIFFNKKEKFELVNDLI